MGERSEMGRWEEPLDVSLFDLGIGMILASFQTAGMVFSLSARL